MSEDQGLRDAAPEGEGKPDPQPAPAPGSRDGGPRDSAPRDSGPRDSGPWNSGPGEATPGGDGGSGDAERQEMTNEREESLDYDDGSSRPLRFDFQQAKKVRDVAGRDINYHFHDPGSPRRAPGRIGVADLARAARVHVAARSDGQLEQSLREDLVVFVRGGIGTGRRASAVVVLDRITGRARRESKVTVLETTSGLAELPDRLEPGRGHLLDASEANWVDTITDGQITAARGALRGSGFLVILVESDSARSLPSTVVDHLLPDLAEVLVFQLASRLAADTAPDAGELDTRPARALLAEACHRSEAVKAWHEEITSATTFGPDEAVLFAEAISDWRDQRVRDPGAEPRVEYFRDRRRYQRAADLLRQGDGTDSPLRQSYAISAAVLDGLAVSEIIEGARVLSALLAEVEHPGAPGHREVFAQPLARWLRHVELAAPSAERDAREGTVVKMPSRELATIVIEVAWRYYDAARPPMLDWLMSLCEGHPNDQVRVRASQALAVIARHDYALIKERVLEPWSTSFRPIEHQAAAWLLEAMVLGDTVAEKVQDLLRRWSRSGDRRKRALAVRAYGTAVALSEPVDAIRGVRFSAVDPWLGALPELAMCEMYRLGLTREVMTELLLWMRGFPAMRERSGRVLVRVSRVRTDSGSPAPYDLLWRLAHAPDEVGIGMPDVAALWHVACRDESSRSAAWQMLGRWAQSCRDEPALRGAFTMLADEFEKKADTDELRVRLGVYRRRWAAYLDEEENK
jgi:hypothetical protein